MGTWWSTWSACNGSLEGTSRFISTRWEWRCIGTFTIGSSALVWNMLCLFLSPFYHHPIFLCHHHIQFHHLHHHYHYHYHHHRHRYPLKRVVLGRWRGVVSARLQSFACFYMLGRLNSENWDFFFYSNVSLFHIHQVCIPIMSRCQGNGILIIVSSTGKITLENDLGALQVMEKNAKWWWWCCCWDWFWGMKERKRRREIWIEKGGGAQGVSYSWSWTIARINGQNGLNRTHMPNNSPCVHVNLHLSSTALEILYLFLSLSIWSWESNYDM